MKRALFLDRDGILNARLIDDYVCTPSQLVPLFGLVPLLVAAQQQGWLLIIISNQQGVGKGLMSQDDLHSVDQALRYAFAEQGVHFDRVDYCTDVASANSFRRKPQPGMLLEAAAELSVDLSTSWFIGDSLSDAQAGRAAGCRTILVGEFDASMSDLVVADLRGIPMSLLESAS